MADEKNKPVKNFKCGAVGVAVWENETKDKPVRKFYTVSGAVRTYKAGDEFKSTSTLRISDIPDAVVCLEEAYKFAKIKNQGEDSEEDTE